MPETISGQPEGPIRPAPGRGFAAILLAGLFAFGSVPVFMNLLNHDVAWYLIAADRVLDGERLYVEIIEPNPPVIVWLTAMTVGIARLSGISAILAFRLSSLVVLAGSLMLSAWALRRTLPDRPGGRLLALTAALAIFLPVSGYEFGEREHLMFAMILPYLILAAGRGRGTDLGGGLPWIAGCLAGLGIAFKPHFVLLWIGVEGYLAMARKGWRVWLRPENLALMATGLACVIATLAFTPEYAAMVRWLWPVYKLCAPGSWLTMLDHPSVMLSVVAWLCYSMVRPRGPYREFCRIFLIADASMLAAALLQYKGYGYHYYPALGSSMLLLGCLFLETREPIPGRPRWAGVLGGGLAASMVIFAIGDRVAESRVWGVEPKRSDTDYGRLARFVEKNAAGGSVFVFSPAVIDAFPMVNEAGAGWASRHPCLWFLAAYYRGPAGATPAESYRSVAAMGATERYLFDTVIVDLLRDRPELILVEECRRTEVYCVQPFDYLTYYGRDPRFAALLREYEPMPKMGLFRPYRRRAGLSGPVTIRTAISDR